MDGIDYKPKYKDVAATFKYGKNIGTFLIVMLTLLLLVCVAIVAMGIAFIVIDGVVSEYLALLVGVIIVGLCGIGFCAYVYCLVYKRYEEINKWIEDAVFVDGKIWVVTGNECCVISHEGESMRFVIPSITPFTIYYSKSTHEVVMGGNDV